MRRASTSPSIQLFPFLAVLVCAMGALILLLLVTTRKMRQVAVARAAAEAEESARPAARPVPTPEPVPAGPTPEELAAIEADKAARDLAVASARKRPATREAEWQRELAEAEIALNQRRQRVAETEQELSELKEKMQSTEAHLQHLIDGKSQLKSDLDKDAKLRARIEREHAELSEAIAAAQRKLAALRRTLADAASKFAFIPYDGASGTARRPVYIECTSTGIRFQPENQLLDESDLKGFTESFNPLLVASQRLLQYWREQSVATDDPRHPSRPYVLILVRPKGTIAYYVARKMLSNLGDDFGYELIEEDFQLQLPPADPMAIAVIQHAIADTLKNRGEMLAAGGRVGEPRLGDVLIGRSEELIEFGTLDDQVAASIHREENPFQKNSGGQGKSFTITRSPVQKDEMSSGVLKSTLAERERRRAQGVPDSLASMVGRGNGTKARGTGKGDGTLATGDHDAQPGGVAVAENSQPGRNRLVIQGPAGDGMGDPFSREHRATGNNGAGSADGTVSNSERTAGDASGSTSRPGPGAVTRDGTSGSTTGLNGSRTADRADNGLPSGAKAGKVIEIPTNASTVGNGTGTTGTRARTKITTRAMTPEGKLPADSDSPPGFDSAGGGNQVSGGGSTNKTAARSQEKLSGFRQPGTAGRQSGDATRSIRGDGESASEDLDTAFRKPQPPASRGQTGGMKSRSTDPQAQQARQYGDNPEARQQLAASSSSVMQKRDAAKRRWGGSNTGQIGYERKVNVEVTADRIFIERDDIEVIIEPETTPDELLEAVLSALDEHSQEWGRPPSKFYWVPYIHFEIYTSGIKEYERLHRPLRDWGVFSEAEFKAGERPTSVVKKGLIQPVSESKTTNIKSTKKKSSGPAESPLPRSDEKKVQEKKSPEKKSPFSWFKKLIG